MSLPLRKRTVHFYEIHIKSRTASDVTSPSACQLDEMLSCFTKLASAKKLPITVRDSKNTRIELSDWRYDRINNCYELLINKANSALSDIALREMTTTTLRMANKTRTEGVEISAHVIVKPNSDGQTATLLLTMGAGISHGDIDTLFRMLSSSAFKNPSNKDLFFFDVPSGAKVEGSKTRKYRVSYGFTSYAHKGQTLNEALQGGVFQSMELIAYEQSAFDAGGNLQIKQRALSIDSVLPKAVTGASVRNAIRHFKTNPDGVIYNKLRIHYKTVAGRSASAVLNINDLDAAFTMKEHIEFGADVESQHTKLNATIVSGMKSLLKSIAT